MAIGHSDVGGERVPPRPLVPVALALIAGIAVGLWTPFHWWLAWWCGLAGVCVAFRPLRSDRTRRGALLLAIAAVGVAALRLHETLPAWHIAHRTATMPRAVALRGVVVEDPANFWDAWGQARTTAVIETSVIRDDGRWFATTGLVRVALVGRDTRLRYGDEVVLEGELADPRNRRQADAFDWRAHLARQGIYATLRVPAYRPVVVVSAGGGHRLWRCAFGAREAARRLLRRRLDGESSGLLLAMLLGERAGLDRDTQDAFIRTGTVHILSVSGLHVGLIAALILGCLRLVRVGGPAGDALAIAWLIFYAVLTGGRVPIVRSTIMIGAWLIGRRLERPAGLLQTLALAAIVVLLWRPPQLADAGFQLSFGSVLAIALFVPALEQYWPSHRLQATRTAGRSDFVARSRRLTLQVVGWWRASILVSFGCWLGIAPLVARHYHLVSPVTVIANLFVIPLLGVVLGLGMLLVAAGWCGWLTALVAWPTAYAIHLLLRGIAWLARIPGGWWTVTLPWWAVIGVYGLLAWWLRHRWRLMVGGTP